MNHKYFISLLLITSLLTGCSNKPDKVWTHADYGVYHASLTKDGRYAIVASVDNQAKLWDLMTEKLLYTWQHTRAPGSDIINTAISPDGKLALTLEHRTFAIWDVKSGKTLRYYQMPANVLTIKISHDNKLAVGGLMDHTARVIDLNTGDEIMRLFHDEKINEIVISSDDSYVLTGSENGIVKLWELDSGKKLAEYKLKSRITSLAISNNNKYIFTAGGQYEAYVWDTVTGEKKYSLKLHRGWTEYLTKTSFNVSEAIFTHDNKKLITGSPTNTIRVWDMSTGQLETQFQTPKRNSWKPPGSVIHAIATNKNDSMIITLGSDGMGYAWSLN